MEKHKSMRHLHDRPLSTLMLRGHPPWATTSWSAELATGEQIRDRIPTVGWYEAWMTDVEIKTMGGYHSVDGPFRLSFFVAGHTVNGVVCIFIPLLQIQAELSASKFVEGHPTSWDYEAISESTRANNDYQDGRNDQNVGILDSEKGVGDVFAELEERVSTEPFVRSPPRSDQRGNQGRSLRTHEAAMRVASERANDAWKAYDALASLVPAFTDRPTAELLTLRTAAREPGGKGVDDARKCWRCKGPRQFGGSCRCGASFQIAALNTEMMRPRGSSSLKSPSQGGPVDWEDQHARDVQKLRCAEEAHEQRVLELTAELSKMRRAQGTVNMSNVSVPAVSPRRSARIGAASIDQDEVERAKNLSRQAPAVAPLVPDVVDKSGWTEEDHKMERYAQMMSRMVRDAVSPVLENLRQGSEVARQESESAMRELTQEVLAQQNRTFERALEESSHIVTTLQQGQERLQKVDHTNDDQKTERREDRTKFGQGTAGVIEFLRASGRGNHGVTNGCDGQRAFIQVGIGKVNSALYLAIVEGVSNPNTTNAMNGFDTQDKIFNFVRVAFGGAPDVSKVHGAEQLLKFDGGFSIYDARQRPEGKLPLGVTFYAHTVPKREAIKCKTDVERAAELFKSIDELVWAWKNGGAMVGVVYGPGWCDVFEACGEQMRQLYDEDPDMYTIPKLMHLANVGLFHWATMARRMSTDPHLMPSQSEQELAFDWGFLLPTAIPGGGFGKSTLFMQHNLVDPYLRDVLITMHSVMGRVPIADRARMGYSILPYRNGILPSVVVGADEPGDEFPCAEVASYDNGALGLLRSSEMEAYGPSSAWGVGRESTGESRAGKGYDKDGHRARSAGVNRADTAGRGMDSAYNTRTALPPGPAGVGPPGSRVMLRIPAHHVKTAFGTMPNAVDEHGASLGPGCFRYWCCTPEGADCPSGCTSHPGHPQHRVGQTQCSRAHGRPQELTWLHAAVALQYGGLKAEFGLPRAPKDVIELQKLCDQAVKNYEGKIAVPAGFLRRVAVGEADVAEEEAWYL